MNEEEVILEEVPADTEKTELIVEQSDLDKVFSFPIFEQVTNIDANMTNVDSNILQVLEAIQAQNEYLIPTEEELEIMALEEEEAAELEALAELPPEELTAEEQAQLDEAAAEALAAEELALSETEITIEYLPKIHQEMVLQNEKMDELILGQNDSNQIAIESSLMLSLAIVITIGVKVFIDQVTKW